MPAIHGPNYGRPTLDLNFAKNKSLIDTVTGRNLVTFGRAQANYRTTYVGADGLIKYAAADEPRFDHNPLTGECLGLLVEEPRSNIKTYSQVFSQSTGYSGMEYGVIGISTNVITAPDGTFTGSLLTSNGSGSSKILGFSGLTSLSSSIYTISLFVKKGSQGNRVSIIYNNTPYDGIYGFNFDSPSGNYTAYPNEWYRIWFTTTTVRTELNSVTIYPSAVNSTVAGDNVYIWGVQVEAGSFPTSYIPTSGSTVTRSADSASITGTNFTSFYNQSQGTVFVNFNKKSTERQNPFAISDGSVTNRIGVYYLDTSVVTYTSSPSGGYDQSVYTTSSPLSSKYVIGYTSGNTIPVINGAFGTTITETAIPTNNTLFLGRTETGGTQYALNGTISRLTYYPTRLQDFQLQQLTK